jgi:cysteine-rich repeat protein
MGKNGSAMKKLAGYTVLALAALVLWAPRADAYETYSQNRDDTNCRACHGDFRDSGYQGTDGELWGDDPHDVHRRVMLNSDCSTCHGSGFFPVGIGFSAGGVGFPAIGCVGCHGRTADTGNDSLSAGYGAGLRQHHTNAGAPPDGDGLLCADCHSDSDPGFYTPVGEDILPDYYFMPPDPDLEHPDKPTDSCNPNGEEDYAGSTRGLDNDGNLLYDTADPTCAEEAECGNGIVEPGEDCDDGNELDGDCCSAECQFEPEGSSCEDGLFCNGEETCDGAGSCQAGAPVDCSDGVGCTDDSCDEDNDECVNDANDLNCPDDGMFCNGVEFCDAVADCSSTGDPCPDGTVCDEANDDCMVAADCGNGILESGEDCDDGNTLDGDCCSANCTFEPEGSSCEDGEFCNGEEVCDGAGTCLSGEPVDCDDGVGCTVDSCDEAADACANAPDDGLCDDGEFCNGAETCDLLNDCELGDPVDCSDGVGCTDDSCDEVSDECVNDPNDANCPDDGMFCNGMEFCDAANDCSSMGDPCPGGTVCNEDTETCDAEPGCGDGVVDPGEDCDDGNTLDGDCCSADCTFEPEGSSCDDGEFCNGEEVCDGAGTCLEGDPVDCSDGIDCTVDACNEIEDVCENTPNDNLCPDDGMFCTGQEVCDAFAGCVSTGDPCLPDGVCNEDTDTCEAAADCGDGIVDPGEDCDDGNTLDGDCCSADCTFEPEGSSCDDGEFCNGEEVCDGAGTCLAGDPVDCSDGVGCTVDACNEVDDACENIPNDSLCPDDGLFCTGDAVCDAFAGCVSTGDPCVPDGVCDEEADICTPISGKVTICHIPRGNPSKATTKTLPPKAAEAHLRHGDVRGPCESSSPPRPPVREEVTICHIPGGNLSKAKTQTLRGKAVDAHLRHGDLLGPCESSSPPEAPASHEASGPPPAATVSGPSERLFFPSGVEPKPSSNERVTICHVPWGNPSKARTQTLRGKAVDAHLRHGDLLGPCESSSLPGATLSHEVSEPRGSRDRVTICHIPRGDPSRARTLSTSARALEAHLRHGDLVGPCE